MMTSSELHTAIPILLSLDVAATARFYTTRLGFSCRHQTPGLAILQRDAVTIHFTKCDDRHLVEWSACRVGVTGVDALYEEYSQQGALHPKSTLRDTDYGTREFGVVDIHGALVTFYENMPEHHI
jgi:hypothetical protein